VDGAGEFYDRLSGEKFVPRGSNYVRLAPMGYEGNLWHSTLNPGFYDPRQAEAALRQMHALGYNTVRVFIDCCRKYVNVGDPKGFLSSAYLDIVVDFLNKAMANDIFVILSLDATPADGGYNELWQECCEIFDARNLRYLTSGGITAKRRYDQDFIRGLINHHAPFEAILGYDLTNEVHFDADKPPFTLTSGSVTTANGVTYNLSSVEDKQRMMDENLVYWIDRQREAIRELDPGGLVSVSFFCNPYLVDTRAAIWKSSADYFDLHVYLGQGLTLAQYVQGFGMEGFVEKPIIMGEFGAFKSHTSSVTRAAQALQTLQVDSCPYGFDGWLLWTWDGEEQTELWNGASGGGVINQALSPLTRPDPCQPGGFAGQNVALGKPARASRSLPSNPPGQAVDGVPENWWGAGDFAPQWIEIDLQAPVAIAQIDLLPGQSPDGETVHRLWGRGPQENFRLLHEFRGFTFDNQYLVFTPESPVEGIQFIRIATVSSPSWVSWREIEVIAAGGR